MDILKADHTLIGDGFEVMIYTSDDPIVTQELEAMGCVAIMPLGRMMGSGPSISQSIHPFQLLSCSVFSRSYVKKTYDQSTHLKQIICSNKIELHRPLNA